MARNKHHKRGLPPAKEELSFGDQPPPPPPDPRPQNAKANFTGVMEKIEGTYGVIRKDDGETLCVFPSFCYGFGFKLPHIGARVVFEIGVDEFGAATAEEVFPECSEDRGIEQVLQEFVSSRDVDESDRGSEPYNDVKEEPKGRWAAPKSPPFPPKKGRLLTPTQPAEPPPTSGWTSVKAEPPEEPCELPPWRVPSKPSRGAQAAIHKEEISEPEESGPIQELLQMASEPVTNISHTEESKSKPWVRKTNIDQQHSAAGNESESWRSHEWTEAWHNFCNTYGEGVSDPAEHNAAFLRRFLDAVLVPTDSTEQAELTSKKGGGEPAANHSAKRRKRWPNKR